MTGHVCESFEAAGRIHDATQRYSERCKHLAVVRTSLYSLDPHDLSPGEPEHIFHEDHKKCIICQCQSYIYIAQRHRNYLYCTVYIAHTVNSCVFRRHLKLSLLSTGSRRLSSREFQVARPTTEKAR